LQFPFRIEKLLYLLHFLKILKAF